MTDFKKKVQSIIEDYCEGINHLEFSIDKFPEMLDRIETEALRIHDVVGRSEQLPPNPITDKEHKDLIKSLYPKDNSKRFRR